MSGFKCSRNADVDCADLQSQFSGETAVFSAFLPHACCACGLRCRQYVKLQKVNARWILVKASDDEPTDACIVGGCCFDAKTLLFTFGSHREKVIHQGELKLEELNQKLEVEKQRLRVLKNL